MIKKVYPVVPKPTTVYSPVLFFTMTQSIQVLDYLISQTYVEKRSKRVKSSKNYQKSIKTPRNLKIKDFTEEYPRKWPNFGT